MNGQRILVWDLPTRAFHWMLVAAFFVALLTSDDNRYLDVHVFGGYVFLALLVFRVLWGAVGSYYARFRAFAYDFTSARQYLKALATGRAARYIGHNPAGSWAIFAMLALGLIVAVTGLIVLGGEERHGPLASFIPYIVGQTSHELHEVLAWTMAGLAGVHVLGVIVESLVHRENLVAAMFSGYKYGQGGLPVAPRNVVGVILFLLAIASGLLYFWGYMTQLPDRPYRPFTGPQLPQDATWNEECGECHLAYHPTLLPARSWKALLDHQADHFGDDLSLDEDTIDELWQFARKYSAESHLTEPAWKIDEMTPATQTPLRITETNYWRKKHREIDDKYWKHSKIAGKDDCGGCHLDAKEGTFEDAAMRLPKLVPNKTAKPDETATDQVN